MRISDLLPYIVLTITICLHPVSLKAEYSDYRGHNTDSLETVLRSGVKLSDKERADIYDDLMWGYVQTDGEKMRQYAEQLLDLSIKHKWHEHSADAYRLMGQQQWAQASYDDAEDLYNKALDEIRAAEKEKSLSQENLDNNYSVLYGTLGNLYNIQGMPQLATKYYMQALEVFERQNMYEMMATLYSNMGEMFLEMENYDKAGGLYEQSMKYAQITRDSLMINMPKDGLSFCRLYEGKALEALQLAQESERYIAGHPEEEINHARAWSIISLIYLEGMHDSVKAESSIQKALDCMDNAAVDIQSGVLLQLAKLRYEQKKYQEALQNLEEARTIYEGDDAVNIERLTLKSQCLMQLGQSQKALEAMNQTMELEKSISNKNYQSSIREQETLYQIAKKDAEILKEKTLRHQYQRAFYLSLLLLVLLSVFMFLLIRLKKKEHLLGETRNLLKAEEEMNTQTQAITDESPVKATNQKKESNASLLTQREAEILQLLAQGLTNSQIADQLYLSPETVKWYRKRLLQKLEVSNTAALIAKAIQDNLINKEP